VKAVEATPEELVVEEAGETVPPPSITDQLTGTSGTGVPPSAVTRTEIS
jgi:hypothetical protein